MKRYVLAACAALALSSAAVLAKGGHQNLQAAHQHVKQAIEKISAAQKANEFDMSGHAA